MVCSRGAESEGDYAEYAQNGAGARVEISMIDESIKVYLSGRNPNYTLTNQSIMSPIRP